MAGSDRRYGAIALLVPPRQHGAEGQAADVWIGSLTAELLGWLSAAAGYEKRTARMDVYTSLVNRPPAR